MLAESLSRSVSSAALGWLVFVVLIVTSAAVVPLAAWLLRRRLPLARRAPIPLQAVVFGTSQQARRSPRHAVLPHRTLVMAVLVAVLALFLLPGIVALRELGVAGLQTAIALVLPTLLVVLHARRRNESR